MKSWSYVCHNIELKDGSTKKEHRLTLETDSDDIKKLVEKFFQALMDLKTLK